MVCRKCGRKFSKGRTCPRCGTPISRKQSSAYKKAMRFRALCISIPVVVIIIVVVLNLISSSNPLTKADFVTVNAGGESSTDISQCGYVRISNEEFKALNNGQLLDFAKKKVDGSGLAWVSIISESGKGLCFVESNMSVVSYGTLSDNGALETVEHIYYLDGSEYKEQGNN